MTPELTDDLIRPQARTSDPNNEQPATLVIIIVMNEIQIRNRSGAATHD